MIQDNHQQKIEIEINVLLAEAAHKIKYAARIAKRNGNKQTEKVLKAMETLIRTYQT